MQLMERYLELVENGRLIEEESDSIPSVKPSLVVLLEDSVQQGGLPLEGPWRLDSQTGRRLEARAGHVPPGGWRGLASLAAGCDVLAAARDLFEPDLAVEQVTEWSPEETTRRLLESFTRRLVPPTTAAGLFILLGIHPAWGVHVAHRSHRLYATGEPTDRELAREARRAEMFPDETRRVVDEAVYDAVAGIVATLRSLQPDEKYPLDALSGFVEMLCEVVARRARERQPEEGWPGLEPFVDLESAREPSWRVIDFTTADLVDALLVPAGAAERMNDGTFRVAPEAFDAVRVGAMDPDTQHRRLSKFLTGSTECHVA